MTFKRRRKSGKQVHRIKWKNSDDLLYALDPAIWVKEVLGIKPDPWQADLLQSRAKRIILNCSRQSGKSPPSAPPWACMSQFIASPPLEWP